MDLKKAGWRGKKGIESQQLLDLRIGCALPIRQAGVRASQPNWR
jgi:hypothetical protein